MQGTANKKPVIKNADMSDEMVQDAVEFAAVAIDKHTVEKDIAAYIKKVRSFLYLKSVRCLVYSRAWPWDALRAAGV